MGHYGANIVYGTPADTLSTFARIGINRNFRYPSPFGVAEWMVWNRGLSFTEFTAVQNYLMQARASFLAGELLSLEESV